MSERTIDVNLTRTGADTITPEDIQASELAEYKARIAQVLDRGYVQHRLHVDLPQGIHGEWVPDIPEEIEAKRVLGFEIDEEYAKKRAIHNSQGLAKIGDTVFMTIPSWKHNIIMEERQRRFDAIHGKPGDKRQIEERQFESNIASLNAAGNVTPTVESSVAAADAKELKAAIDAQDK